MTGIVLHALYELSQSVAHFLQDRLLSVNASAKVRDSSIV
jgi:hypothetical protein